MSNFFGKNSVLISLNSRIVERIFKIRIVEKESQALIDTNAIVFAENASLAEARQINGLRALPEEVKEVD